MNDLHTNQLKKHILAVSTCKIHRLKTNSVSVTILDMVRCLYSGRSVLLYRLCVSVLNIYMCVCVHRHILPITSLGRFWETMFTSNTWRNLIEWQTSVWQQGSRCGTWERWVPFLAYPQVAIWLQTGSCFPLGLFLFPSSKVVVKHHPLVFTSCFPAFLIMASVAGAFSERMV